MSRVGPLKLKIMLLCGDDTAMGPGKAELLEAIEREGSIIGAGQDNPGPPATARRWSWSGRADKAELSWPDNPRPPSTRPNAWRP